MKERHQGKMNPEAMVPLYQQLYDTIKSKIQNGDYKVGEQIPSESQLSSQYGISRVTVRNAIQQLVDEQILVKKHGKGTFVSMPVYVESLATEGSFSKALRAMGLDPSTNVISIKKGQAGQHLGGCLGINPEAEAITVQRVRLINGTPVILEYDYFVNGFDFLFTADLSDTPLLDTIFKHKGITAKYFDYMVEVHFSTKEQSRYLDCLAGAPLLRVNQTVLTEEQTIVYYNEQFIMSDRYKLTVRSHR